MRRVQGLEGGAVSVTAELLEEGHSVYFSGVVLLFVYDLHVVAVGYVAIVTVSCGVYGNSEVYTAVIEQYGSVHYKAGVSLCLKVVLLYFCGFCDSSFGIIAIH